MTELVVKQSELPERIRTALANRKRVPMAPGPVPAAILVPLFLEGGEYHILFTKRAEHLNHHRGEISFPGGVRHPDDGGPRETALRETWEEVGIRPGDVDVLGELDDYFSIHNYLVTPVVGIFPPRYPLEVNPDEIERIITVPLTHLLRPEIFRVEDWNWKGRTHPVCFFTYEGDEIWGLTAAILKQFLDLTFQR
ncbi:NUDIX hydrolase [Geobacter metallireducens RCH3]|uniref:Coenzyme A pyrophosphatase n=1 Tax=Geobacter metallireducens (strain ATCC 53774 / DSM 7210 / GS-15) TaxID=269799 RepID=Q39ZK7_GEOMG|nr:CoA pyrophosphatase [Geobacter metallireducens]ABB30317.1 coenzyme A pyrophosphatase [Geobacter metallireducens GS-15]EHP84910.1 NUDIX hydrolase [Geobacter metallireducens RCH3]